MIASTTVPTQQKQNLPTREQITQRAHEIWIAEGRPEGQALQHWQRAEKEMCAKCAKPQPMPIPAGAEKCNPIASPSIPVQNGMADKSAVKNRMKFSQPMRTAASKGQM